MRRAPLYSRSQPAPGPAPKNLPAGPKPGRKRSRRRLAAVAAAVAGALGLGIALHPLLAPPPRQLTQQDIDRAVAKSLEAAPLPSTASRAWEAVQGSVVRVRAFARNADGVEDQVASTGTGVVILDKGVILTNIHVVAGAERIGVTFFNGLESEAYVIGTRPEDDLAVLQAKTVPDDLMAATLQSTSGLAPGDQVTAIGFPFGIGPSVSAGVVSGLRREYRSPEGKRVLTNLIQFDAAVNPGNSGGPLVNASGEVVGIVTGILNPTDQRVFVGIGFAVPIENAALAIGVPPF
ncbi:MAG TPA: trypsin-like peptidase domain-containing protein [Burkholderiales bacterium]|nr:trypsin-like peptidase domain-containing protein [Burkholderiales bacterium]